MLKSHHLLSPNFTFPLSHLHNPSLFPPLTSLYRPISPHSAVSAAHLRTGPQPWLAQVPEPPPSPTTTASASAAAALPEDQGPVELPPSAPSIFAVDDNPSTLQVATSVLLTGAISVFLFRSIHRRAKRAKELKFRSSGATKSLKEEAMESLKAMTPAQADAKSPPSAVQALLGGISAGVIALILYKFTTTIEAGLNRQTLSDNFSVRQITITIRTIINGLCYLATFVFGINSVGLVLYSGQLAINSFMGDSTSEETQSNDETKLNSTDSSETDSSEREKSSDNAQ